MQPDSAVHRLSEHVIALLRLRIDQCLKVGPVEIRHTVEDGTELASVALPIAIADDRRRGLIEYWLQRVNARYAQFVEDPIECVAERDTRPWQLILRKEEQRTGF